MFICMRTWVLAAAEVATVASKPLPSIHTVTIITLPTTLALLSVFNGIQNLHFSCCCLLMRRQFLFSV